MEPHNHPQFVLGRQRLAAAIRHLLSQNGLSHAELDQLAAWAATDEQSGAWLAKSQISSLANAKLPKPGGQIFLSLAQINRALAELAAGCAPAKPLPPKLRRLAVGPGPWFLAHPISGQPCDEGDWFRIYCGTFSTDDLEDLPEIYSKETAIAASEKLAQLAQAWTAGQQLGSWRAGREEIASIYRVKERARRERLLEVVSGDRKFNATELDDEREALRFLIGRLLGRDALSVREFDRWAHGRLEE